MVDKYKNKYNVQFIDDLNIQATKDMNGWLDQVDACDCVLSIANTTIHGAGGLRKPTLCLLGQKSDWRWLKDRAVKIVIGIRQSRLHGKTRMANGIARLKKLNHG